MKKSRRILCFLAVALLSVGILASTVFVCYKLQCREAEQIIADAEYVMNTKEDPCSVMKDAIGEGQNILTSYYLGYSFEKPDYYMPVGFHSELRNEKGEVLAEYKPHLVLKGETPDGKDDYRVMVFDDEYTLVSEYSDGGGNDWGINKYPFESIQHCSQAKEANNFDPAEGKPLEIYGTCDDNFIYVEKMVWYNADDSVDSNYIYKPVNDKTGKGKVSVQSWINTLKDKKYVLLTENSVDPYAYTALNDEAKNVCKSLSEDYLEAGCDSSVLSSRKDKYDLKTYAIEKVENIGGGYFVSSVYMLHPLNMVPNDTAIPYSIFIVFTIALIIFMAIAINRKIGRGYVFNVSDEKKKIIRKYAISLSISVIGLVLLPLISEISFIGRLSGSDMVFLMVYIVTTASFIMGVYDVKPVLKFTYPVVNVALLLLSWALVPVWDREPGLLFGMTLTCMAVSLFGVLSGLLFKRIKTAIGMRRN
ncbi:MAG: hypothetical protein J6D06_04575 [Clostridia bacterium]|nr:hypothetical protein [Clostridia bacterium]